MMMLWSQQIGLIKKSSFYGSEFGGSVSMRFPAYKHAKTSVSINTHPIKPPFVQHGLNYTFQVEFC